MRVATKTIYDMVKFNLANITEGLYKANKVVASTKRINSLSDDPVALTQILSIRSSLSNLEQLEKNISTGRSWLNAGETALVSINGLISDAKILCLQMANASVNDTQRADAAELIDGILRQIIPLGNTEINGQHIFAGTKTDIEPFTLDDETTATYDADIADGVSNAANGNFGAGEFKVNGYDVATTYATDDQYSVLEISSEQIDAITLSADANLSFVINGTNFGFTLLSGTTTGASIATAITSAINNASITNVTARVVNTSGWVIQAKEGANLALQFSAAGSAVNLASLGELGMTGTLSTMFGAISGGSAVNNRNGESSAIAKAVAIDAIRSQSGVTATVRPNIVTGVTTVSSGTISSGDIYINGVNIGAATVTASDSTGALVTAINSQSPSTGVMASKDTEGKLVLTATDGRNITITANEQSDVETILGLNWTYFTGTTAIFRSTVRLNDDEAFTLSGALGDLYDVGSGASSDMAKTTDSDKSVAVATTFKVSYSGNNSPATIKIGEDTNIEVGRDGEKVFWDQSVTINSTNDKIDFREDIGKGPGFVRTLTATIPGGTYTASELADAMEDAMNDASADSGHSVTYEVSYDSSTKKFTIREDGRYPGFLEVKLLWETGENAKTSVAPDIGFDMGDDVSSPPTSDNKVVSPINILGTNNTILFRELPAGGELSLQLTVTIPSKNYTDLNELATVIETGMEAASKNLSGNNINYDVSYDSSTEKFTIKESGTDLTELQLLWSGSNAASALGFEAVDDIYTPPASDGEVEWGIFETLIELKGYLEANDVDGIFRSMTKLDSHLDHFSTTISSTGFKEIQLDIKENLIADLNLNYMDRKSSLEDADIIEAIMELKAKEFVYQAALASAARIMGLSLVDYL